MHSNPMSLSVEVVGRLICGLRIVVDPCIHPLLQPARSSFVIRPGERRDRTLGRSQVHDRKNMQIKPGDEPWVVML